MILVKRFFVKLPLSTVHAIGFELWQSGKRYQSFSTRDFDSKHLLSDENRQRCLEKMNSSAPINIKLKGNASEKGFAAVLIAICTNENNENPSLLFTKRSRTLRKHMSQISFPGGIKDEGEDYVQCALRETEEEIGLSPNRVDIWGSGGLVTPPHTAAIMPIIGVVKNFNDRELQLNASEVAEAFTVPISCLSNPNTLRYTQFKSGYSAPVFVVGTKKIWGITGFLTNSFLNCFLPPEMNRIKGRVRYIRPLRVKV